MTCSICGLQKSDQDSLFSHRYLTEYYIVSFKVSIQNCLSLSQIPLTALYRLQTNFYY